MRDHMTDRLNKPVSRRTALVELMFASILAAAASRKAFGTDGAPQNPSTAPATTPSTDLTSLESQLSKAQEELQKIEPEAYKQIPDLKTAEQDVSDYENVGADKGLFVKRTQRFLDAEQQRRGDDVANVTYERLLSVSSDLSRARQFKDPATQSKLKKIWDTSPGWRQKIAAECKRIPEASRPSEKVLDDPEALWQILCNKQIQDIDSLSAKQQSLIKRLQAPAFVSDWAIQTSETNERRGLLESYLAAITPTELQRARDKVKILTKAVGNARTLQALHSAGNTQK